MRGIIALLFCLSVLSCRPALHKVVVRPHYLYIQTAPGEYTVLVADQNQTLVDAEKELCKPVCAKGFIGYAYVITVPVPKD